MKGRKKAIFCTRGHLMEMYRKVHPNGDSYCSKCKTDRSIKAKKDNPQKAKEYARTTKLRKTYGLEKEEFANILESQNNSCAICKETSFGKSLHVDHCHSTGEIRGILCHHCNTGIGLLKESEVILKSCLDYLSKSKKKKK